MTANKCEKYQLLTLLPRSWSLRKMTREFGVSLHMARIAKKLQDDKGPMSSPDQKSLEINFQMTQSMLLLSSTTLTM